MRDMEVALNKSGYYDETASKAINHVMKDVDVKEGEIWFLEEPNGPFTQALILKSCEDYCEVVMLRSNPFDKRDCEIDGLHFDVSRIAYIHKKKLSTVDKQVLPEEFKRCMVEIARSMKFDVYLKGVPEETSNTVLVQQLKQCYEQMRTDICADMEKRLQKITDEIKARRKEEPLEETKRLSEESRKRYFEEHDARVKAETEAQIYKQLNDALMKKLLGDVA